MPADLVAGLQGRLPADVRIGPGAQPLGDLRADLDLHGRAGGPQRLRVGVRDNKIDAPQRIGDHGVDGIAASAARPDYLNSCRILDAYFRQFKHAHPLLLKKLHKPFFERFEKFTENIAGPAINGIAGDVPAAVKNQADADGKGRRIGDVA